MPEHITDERAEQIAALADEIRRAPSRFTKDFVVENLADGVADLSGVIDRLREQLAAANERAETAEQERDLAIAHDRQPYPTAWAYEQACAALAKQRERAETAEARVAHLDKARDAAVSEWKREHDAADALQTENDQLRARLDGLGPLTPAGEEYRANGPFVHEVSEAHFRTYPGGWTDGYWPEVRQLYGGPWRVAPDAAADGHSATESDREGPA